MNEKAILIAGIAMIITGMAFHFSAMHKFNQFDEVVELCNDHYQAEFERLCEPLDKTSPVIAINWTSPIKNGT